MKGAHEVPQFPVATRIYAGKRKTGEGPKPLPRAMSEWRSSLRQADGGGVAGGRDREGARRGRRIPVRSPARGRRRRGGHERTGRLAQAVRGRRIEVGERSG